MPTPELDRHSVKASAAPWLFFGLLFLISTPFWLLGVWADVELLPGLPISSAMVAAPMLAAGLLVIRTGGLRDVWRLIRRAGDVRRMRAWVWVMALSLMPGVMLISALIQTALGQDLPTMEISAPQVLALLALFLLAATAEELGWSGYATGPLVRTHGVLVAGLSIGAVAALWHLIPLLQVDRSWDWIAWWALGSIARRVCIVWMYVQGGQSVFSTSLFHAMGNLSWMLFPVMGSHYDPMVTGLILAAIAAALLLRSAMWSRGGRG